MPATGTNFNYNNQGVFQSGWLTSDGWRAGLTGDGVRFDTDTRYQTQTTTTTDWSNGFKYNLNDHMILSGDFQLVKSTSNELDFTVFQTSYLPGLFLNTTGSGGMPSVTVNPANYTSNPANYFWNAAMDSPSRFRSANALASAYQALKKSGLSAIALLSASIASSSRPAARKAVERF